MKSWAQGPACPTNPAGPGFLTPSSPSCGPSSSCPPQVPNLFSFIAGSSGRFLGQPRAQGYKDTCAGTGQGRAWSRAPRGSLISTAEAEKADPAAAQAQATHAHACSASHTCTSILLRATMCSCTHTPTALTSSALHTPTQAHCSHMFPRVVLHAHTTKLPPHSLCSALHTSTLRLRAPMCPALHAQTQAHGSPHSRFPSLSL